MTKDEKLIEFIKSHMITKANRINPKDILENFDENLSETQNMLNHGYRQIFDCGNLVYVLE